MLVSIGISILAALYTVLVFGSYAQKIDQRFSLVDNKIEGMNQTNDTYRQQVYAYLTYQDNRINSISQSYNLSSRDSLQRINNLEKENSRLNQSYLELQAGYDDLSAYIAMLNVTNITTYVVYNISASQASNKTNSTADPGPPVPGELLFQYAYPCMTNLISQYGLGRYTCARADCDRSVGWQADACTCWDSFNASDQYRC